MDTNRTVTVSGEGTISAKPDIAEITVGVHVIAPALAEAGNQADAQMTRVIDALRANGIASDDLRTTQVNVNAQQDYEKHIVIGYVAPNGVRVTVHDLSRLAARLGAVVAAGEVYELQFRLANSEPMRRRIRAAAIDDAKNRAEEYAQRAGATLGPVLQISEDALGSAARAGYTGGGPLSIGGTTDGLAASTTPVESGDIDVTARVQTVWELS